MSSFEPSIGFFQQQEEDRTKITDKATTNAGGLMKNAP